MNTKHENGEDIILVQNKIDNTDSGWMSGARLLPISILAAAILLSSAIIFASVRFTRTPAQTANVGDTTGANGGVPGTAPAGNDRDVVLGDANAPISIIEYGDYQCPFCVKFFKETEPAIRENYIKTGKVKMVFRGFQFLGPESLLAAEGAECAKDQKKFWDFHDGLYLLEETDGQENNGNITNAALVSLAKNKGLDGDAFSQCLSSGKYADQVKKDTASAQSAGVRSTPTVYVNGQKFEGAYPFETFKQVIDEALKK